MYLKHVRLYKRHSNLKKPKRRLTLNHFDAILRCKALIIKMARLRFPGRPGQRIGKSYVKYVYDDVKMNVDGCPLAYNKIQVGLKLFYELFGYSDEEEEFEGFTKADLIQAEATVAQKLRTKEAVHRYLDSSQELSSSAASDVEKIFSSSESDTSSSSMRRKRGMRDILRKSYDKMLKHGLDVHNNSLHSNKSNNLKETDIRPYECQDKSSHENIENVNSSVAQADIPIVDDKVKDDKSTEINPKDTHKKDFVRQFINKAKRLKAHPGRKRSLRPNVKRKYGKNFLYPKSKKYSKSIQKTTRSHHGKQVQILKHTSRTKTKIRSSKIVSKFKQGENLEASSSSSSLPSDTDIALKPKNPVSVGRKKLMKPSVSANLSKADEKVDSCTPSEIPSNAGNVPKRKHALAVGRKRFILPSMSARSSRKIIPRKRYLDELEQLPAKIADDDSQCSRSSVSGSSEAISAMDGESSPDDTQLEDNSQNLKKVGLLDQPLVVEGKRPWKPSLKVQMKLSEMNCDYPFALKKNMDGSSGTSSGSFKDIIKPDMVSKYAEKMAQKPKEKPLKVEGTKKYSHSMNPESEEDEVNSDSSEDPKKGDKLEKVAAKIEKLLKSQWEGRLKNSKTQSSKKLSSEIMAQWKTEQQQRSTNQRRTKSILRKARLQINKRNLNLRTRQSAKQTVISAAPAQDLSTEVLTEKAQNCLPVVELKDISSLNLLGVSNADDSSPASNCIICGSSFLYSSKLQGQLACESCNRFFEGFVKTPKQFFCKDGMCCIDSKVSTPRRPTNSRCKACWLKACIVKLTISPAAREEVVKYVPRFDAPPHNSLLTVENEDADTEADEDNLPVEGSEDFIARGPRIKHVCRRAAVVLGLPRATFADVSESKESFNLSALPEDEKQKILETIPPEAKSENPTIESEVKVPNSPKSIKQPVRKKIHKDFKIKNRVHVDLLKKSALLIHKEQKKKKLQMKKSTKHLHKHSYKKSMKLKNQMKKTVKFSYKSAVKTSIKLPPKIIPKCSNARPVKFRKVRCKECVGCLAADCGHCAYCLDKKKFGGPNIIKQACMFRRCLKPVLPASERKDSKMSGGLHFDKGKHFGGHSSFGGDGPSGIGRSLTSSSSSLSSPDGSSCGSSCSSSSSSSSSGSSGSSSSSSSSSSTSSSSSSSSSNNVSASNSLLINNCVKSSLMPNFDSQSVILHESECTDNNVTIFPDSMYTDSSFVSEPTLHDLISQKAIYGDGILDSCDYKDGVDTILYEDSSSIIELKNASYGPSLIYGASLGDESTSYSSSSGSRSQGTENRNCRKSQYNNKDQYGSGSNGDDNEEDDDDDEDDEDEKKKQFILADYWEDYDFERISSQGYALISSQQIPLLCVCYLCGSAGQEKLIFCMLCCEPFHTFCLSEEDVPSAKNIENWCCKRCQSCAVCGSKNNLLKCRSCQNTYHAECLAPHYPTKPSRRKKVWVCPKCVKCKSCGATASSLHASGQIWNFDSLLCQSCAKLTDKGSYCPVCHKCYEENDYESEMVQCNRCSRWVHATCDDISAEAYEILSCLPETLVYTCTVCTKEETPAWRLAIFDYRTSRLKSVLSSLLYSKCARHLVKLDSTSKNLSYLNIQSSQDKSIQDTENSHISSELSTSDTENLSSSGSSILKNVKCDIDVKTVVSELVSSIDSSTSSDNSQSENSSGSTEKSEDKNKVGCPELLEIRHKVDRGSYKSVVLFFTEVTESLEKARSNENKQYVNEAKKIIIEELVKSFPFFKIPETKTWINKGDYPEGMLPNAVVPPSDDHIYSQYLERVQMLVPPKDQDQDPTLDIRACVLCGYTGDSNPKKCGRLLYCGQDDWIHVNCALWSAEVFQQQDGSLRNVYPAIARGKLMPCEFCNQLGATVGCCVRGCPANYHFYCARKDEAVLQEDKKVFCALHKDHVDAKIMKDNDFIISQKMFIHQNSISPKWVKESWESAKDIRELSVHIGSLTVHKLGHLVKLSDSEHILIPVDYECSRLFWSTKNPRVRVKYTCRIKEVQPNGQTSNVPSNTTIVHSHETQSLKEETSKNFVDKTGVENDTLKNSKDLTSHETSDISNDIMDDVIKVINRLIKKVIKSQRKYWKKMKRRLVNFKGSDSEKNTLLDEYKICEAKMFLNVLDSSQENLSSEKELQKDDNQTKCNDVESHRKMDGMNCTIAYKKLMCDISNMSILNNEKNCDQWKSSYPEIFRKYLQKVELKKLKKRLKFNALSNQHFEESSKLLNLISEKDDSNEILERVLNHYKDGSIPSKVASMLDSVLPPCSVSETVLPIFIEGNENSGVNESSGYSSNDDTHVRPPAVSRAVPIGASKLKENSKLKNKDDKSGAAWMRDIKLNGRKDFSQSLGANSVRSNRTVSEAKLNSRGAMENSANMLKNFNGISQDVGPFKCAKCKRVYRTSESYSVHMETCNFFVDSSSTEEESSDSSSDGSDESSESSSDENMSRDLNRYPLKKPTSAGSSISKDKNGTVAKPLPSGRQNVNFEKTKVGGVPQRNLNSIPLSRKPVEVKATENRGNASTSSASKYYKSPHQSQHAKETKSFYPPPQKVNRNQQAMQHVPYRPVMPSERVLPNVSLNVNRLPLNAGPMPNNFNVGYSNAVCNNVPAGIVQLPCNTLIIPPGAEALQPPNQIIQLPSNNFYNASIDLNQSTQLSYVGSLTLTNNDMPLAINMSDQMVPMFPQHSINFGQPTLIPSHLQVQQSAGFQLSALNVQQISLQGAFQTNSLNPFIFPQQTLNIPQNQVMFIEEPMVHPLSSNATSSNFVYQVPVPQPNNPFTSFVSQQQYMSPITFTSNVPSNQNSPNDILHDQFKEQFSQVEKASPKVVSMPALKPEVEKTNTKQRLSYYEKVAKSAISPEPAYSPKCSISSSTPPSSSCTTTPNVSNRSTPVPEASLNIQPLKIQPDSHIMDILKKAAEQVLSLSDIAKRKAQAQDTAESGAPEKKTRFAHTRKVAARKAEKLKLKKCSSVGNVINQQSAPKTKTDFFHLTLKPSFSIPVVPVSSSVQNSSDQNNCAPALEAPPIETEDHLQIAPEPEISEPEIVSERSRRPNCKVVSYKEEEDQESDEEASILLKIQKHETQKSSEDGGRTTPHIVYEISSEDGFSVQSSNIRDAWEKIYDALQDSRIANYMKQIPVAPQDIDGLHMMGLDNSALVYLVEQLPGAENCQYYDFVFHKPLKEIDPVPENPTGSARSEIFKGRREYDMFNFLASEHRNRPVYLPPDEEDEGSQKSARRATPQDLPIAMRFRNLKTVARETVGVYRSSIHGRGLFCKRNIDAGELVIEYAGEVIRSVLTDKRERIYQSKGIGCYMFRIDDDEVVDATMHGNAARFINHACEPNCFSKVITVDGKKHIVIFALRRITKGEELTYDYKFPFEDEKIPCHCNSRRCKKYLN